VFSTISTTVPRGLVTVKPGSSMGDSTQRPARRMSAA
jgi:hypothetical protein